MPRKYVPKGVRQMDRTNLEAAFKHRVDSGCSMKVAAEMFGVKKTTLVDAFNRSKKLSDGVTYVPVQPHSNRVFTPEQELLIVEYLILAAKMFYGLPKDEVRRMVFHYAQACGSTSIPDAWEKEQKATRDWYYAFMDRHPTLVLKAPEGMSIARIVAFNKVNVETFFTAYTLAMEKYKFTPDRIYNVDESSLTTVMKPVKVVCEKGQPVATQVTRERGDSMTFVGIINAVGQTVPPVFLIPRKKWNQDFMRNTTYGSKGILQPNGWMNGERFVETLQHIHEKTGSSVENKILLIMDNAECHMNIHVVEYAIKHGIVIVTLPPHTTAKLQPLDVSVFGPFKVFLRNAQADFNLTYPNQPITVHQLPQLACDAWIKAANPANILSGFKATGIWPINRDIFSEDAFVGAQVTERPAPQETDDEDQPAIIHSSDLSSSHAEDGMLSHVDDVEPSNSGADSSTQSQPSDTLVAQPSTPSTPGPSRPVAESTPGPSHSTPGSSKSTTPGSSHSTPGSSHPTPDVASVRPLPKAPERPHKKGRKKIPFGNVTENQEAIDGLREKFEKRQAKEQRKKKAQEKKKNTEGKKGEKPAKRRRTVEEEEETDDEEEVQLQLDDSSEYSDELEDDDLTAEHYPFAEKAPEVGDFVLTELPYEKGRNAGSLVCLVAQVMVIEDDGRLTLSFLRMKQTCLLKNIFNFPIEVDVMTIKPEQCKGVLTVRRDGTKRQAGTIKIFPPLSAFRML